MDNYNLLSKKREPVRVRIGFIDALMQRLEVMDPFSENEASICRDLAMGLLMDESSAVRAACARGLSLCTPHCDFILPYLLYGLRDPNRMRVGLACAETLAALGLYETVDYVRAVSDGKEAWQSVLDRLETAVFCYDQTPFEGVTSNLFLGYEAPFVVRLVEILARYGGRVDYRVSKHIAKLTLEPELSDEIKCLLLESLGRGLHEAPQRLDLALPLIFALRHPSSTKQVQAAYRALQGIELAADFLRHAEKHRRRELEEK